MPSTTCPYCKRYSHMTERWATFHTRPSQARRVHAAFTCDQCQNVSIGVVRTDAGDTHLSAGDVIKRHPDDQWSWLPKTGVAPAFPDVPKRIAAAAREAHEAASINIHMASILMARTVVEAAAKEKDVTTGSLYNKIDKLKELNLIRPGIAEAAHEIRHLGNDMAHGDLEDEVSGDDVADVLTLMDQVLNELFQGPALIAKLRAKRTGG